MAQLATIFQQKSDKIQKYLLKLMLKSTSRKVKKNPKKIFPTENKIRNDSEICSESTDRSTKILSIEK